MGFGTVLWWLFGIGVFVCLVCSRGSRTRDGNDNRMVMASFSSMLFVFDRVPYSYRWGCFLPSAGTLVEGCTAFGEMTGEAAPFFCGGSCIQGLHAQREENLEGDVKDGPILFGHEQYQDQSEHPQQTSADRGSSHTALRECLPPCDKGQLFICGQTVCLLLCTYSREIEKSLWHTTALVFGLKIADKEQTPGRQWSGGMFPVDVSSILLC